MPGDVNIASAPTLPVRSLRESEAGKAIRAARMCYGHLAGVLGVSLARALVERQILDTLDEGYLITDHGKQWLYDFGIDRTVLKKSGVLVVPCHIDWSERRHHIAGAFGAALARRLVDLEWIKRAPTGRAMHITESGRKSLEEEFGICLVGSGESAPEPLTGGMYTRSIFHDQEKLANFFSS